MPSATTARSSRSIVACSSISAAASAGTSPTSAWASRQRGEDVQPGRRAAAVVEQRVRLGRRPEMPVDRASRRGGRSSSGITGQASFTRSALRAPRRGWRPTAPPRPSPSTSMPRSIRQHLVSTSWPVATGSRLRGHRSTRSRLVAVEVPVELLASVRSRSAASRRAAAGRVSRKVTGAPAGRRPSPGTAAGTARAGVPPPSSRDVHGVQDQLDRWQVLVEVDGLRGLGEQLRRAPAAPPR